MEKTLGFAINEAIEMGRRSAMPTFLEKELRENIAQEIEEKRKPFLELANESEFYQGVTNGMNFAMVIARNNND